MSNVALHGVNLTGWLSLEPWISSEYFAQANTLDELGLVQVLSHEEYDELIRAHRKYFIDEDDFKNIAARGFNAVRISVPWYVFGNAGPIKGPFIGCADVLDNAFDWADELGLKIVMVLNIQPGNEGKLADVVPEFSSFTEYKPQMINVLAALAKRYAFRAALAGIEVASNPKVKQRVGFHTSGGVAFHQLRNYYREAYRTIRTYAGDDVFVIMPDAQKPLAWKQFMAAGHYKNTMIDVHLDHFDDYFGMTGIMSMQQLVQHARSYIAQAEKTGFRVMVGTWCAALPGLESTTTPEGHIAYERIYTSDQLALYKSCAAWFFQTWKTENRLSGWDARTTFSSFERGMLCAR